MSNLSTRQVRVVSFQYDINNPNTKLWETDWFGTEVEGQNLPDEAFDKRIFYTDGSIRCTDGCGFRVLSLP